MIILGGTGIKSLSHITKETEALVKKSDKVLYLVNEPIVEQWIVKSAQCSESLYGLYTQNSDRLENYKLIVQKIKAEYASVTNLCVLLYGHPTVFSYPGLEAIRQIDKEGGKTRILPGISAEDCLFADLKINPGLRGCISLEATEFLLYDRTIDPSYHVIFWQIGQIGNTSVPGKGLNQMLLSVFCDRICKIYGGNIEVTLYEASLYPSVPPKIVKVKVLDLIRENISTISSLYLPPVLEVVENQSIREMLE